jgi:hypothetical protein
MINDHYFKLFVFVFFVLILTLNFNYQADLIKEIKTVGTKCNTYTFSIPRDDTNDN